MRNGKVGASVRVTKHRAFTTSQLRIEAWTIMDAKPGISKAALETRLRRKYEFEPGTIDLAYKYHRSFSQGTLARKYCYQLADFWRRQQENSN